jgi:predicted GIY-YIG superfamily endonuclease
MEEHRLGLGSQFVKKYSVTRLVHGERFDDPESAIRREKQNEEVESGLEDSIDRRGKS